MATGGISESERVFGGREITLRARDKSGMANDGGIIFIDCSAIVFTGNSRGQSKEACYDTQESLEAREGKRQVFAQEGSKAWDAEKATR